MTNAATNDAINWNPINLVGYIDFSKFHATKDSTDGYTDEQLEEINSQFDVLAARDVVLNFGFKPAEVDDIVVGVGRYTGDVSVDASADEIENYLHGGAGFCAQSIMDRVM